MGQRCDDCVTCLERTWNAEDPKEVHLDATFHADMCLGEGTGAVAYLPVLDLAAEVYGRMSTFSENDIEDYKELGEKE